MNEWRLPQSIVDAYPGGSYVSSGLPAVVLSGLRPHSTRRTLPCTKLRNGQCPIAGYERVDCHMRIKRGCPFKGAGGKIDLARVQAYLQNPDALGLWLSRSLYGPNGVGRR